MESFLSLPRSAKGGLAVLLAVALLGWAIVAYSAKQQHEDARSLESTLATLKSQIDGEQAVRSELLSAQERLAAAETELATSRDSALASQQEKGDLEAELAALKAEFAAMNEQTESDSTGQSDGEALRARLTKTMTELSAKNATLQQRERELQRALERAEVAEANVETLSGDVEKSEGLRERLTETMTALSAKTAMLQQRDRDINRMKADQTSAEEKMAGLEAAIAERDDADRSLDALADKLDDSEQALKESAAAFDENKQALADQENRFRNLEAQQTSIEALISKKQTAVMEQEKKLESLTDSVGQEEERLAAQKASIDSANAELADLIAARDESAAENSRLSAEIDSLQTVLSEKEDAIAYAETELERLEGEISLSEQRLAEQDGELEEKASLLNAQNVEMQSVEASLQALKADHSTADEDLAAYKNELSETKAQLASETALLDAKRAELADTDTQIIKARAALENGSSAGQSLPQIPIAALSSDNPAVLPIDPLQHPFPVQTENGIRLALVHFDMGSHELSPGGLRRAKEAAAWIKAQGVEKITLVGATDTIGTFENNMELARRRAQTLFDTFTAEGIDPDNIELVSRGEEGGSEIIDDHTAEPLNRCVGVFIQG
ncbi:MAG: OmpA family protein [Pseudomonadota bacterium]